MHVCVPQSNHDNTPQLEIPRGSDKLLKVFEIVALLFTTEKTVSVDNDTGSNGLHFCSGNSGKVCVVTPFLYRQKKKLLLLKKVDLMCNFLYNSSRINPDLNICHLCFPPKIYNLSDTQKNV